MTPRARMILLVLGALSVVATAQVAPGAAPKLPDRVPLRAWTTDDFDDDSVRAIVPAAGRIYVGGRFTSVGPSASPLLVLGTRKGRQDTAFPQVRGGEVNVVEPDGQGGIYLGGDFTNVGSVACKSLAHVRASGAVDAQWCPRPNGSVSVLVHDKARLYFAGNFTRVRGARRSALAAVGARTGRLTAWRPGRPDDAVRGLAVGGKTVFAVGDFRAIGGRGIHNVAALDARTGRLRRWNAGLDRSSCSTREPCLTTVGAVAIRGSTLYIAGNFDLVRRKTRIGLAALDTRTGRVLRWHANVERSALTVHDWKLVAAGRRIYVLGLFGEIRGTRRDGLAALDSRTGTVLSWRPTLPDPEFSSFEDLAVAGSAVVISSEDDGETDAVRAVDRRTGRKIRWKIRNFPGFLGRLAVSGPRVFAPSSAGVIGGYPRHNLAAFDPRSRRMTSWAPRLAYGGWVLAMAASDTTLYVGGCFKSINGKTRHSLAAFSLRTGKLRPWNPGANGCVEQLALLGQTVYVAGSDITTVGGAPRTGVAAVDASTGVVRPWDPHPGSSAPSTGEAEVLALAVSGGKIYIGGKFTNVGGAERRNLAAIDALTGAATAWDPGLDGSSVVAIEPGLDAVYVSGDFGHVGQTARPQLAAIDPTTGKATAFDAKISVDYIGEVEPMLRRVGQLLFFGGDRLEASFAGKGVYGLATLDASTGRLVDRQASIHPGSPYAIARAGRRLYVGGELNLAGSNGFLVFPF